MISFALAIPHCKWIPARVESFHRLTDVVGPAQVFDEQEPNWAWSAKLWEWGAKQDVTHVVQLQDDVIAAPNFWAVLRAMVTVVPDQIIGLQGAHPAFRQLARLEGKRWARSLAWMVGVGWVMPVGLLRPLLNYRSTLSDHVVMATNEDDMIGQYAVSSGQWIWHPIPTIVDHDTAVESTYANDHHMYRRATVTWREYNAAELERPEFWDPKDPAWVQSPHQETCWFCNGEPGTISSSATHARIGPVCLSKGVEALLTKGAKK